MKNINVPFEDKEIEILEARKKGLSWHDYIMQIK